MGKMKLLSVKLLPRIAVLLPVFFSPLFKSTAFYNQMDGFSEFLYSLSLLLIILFSGFLLGISDRRNPFLVTALLLPVLFLVKSSFGSVLSMKLTYGFYFHIMEPFEINNAGVFRMAYRFFYLTGTTLPAALPSLVLIPVFTGKTGLSGECKARIMLGRMLIPILIILVPFLLNFLKFR
jgi:hypothetical protein